MKLPFRSKPAPATVPPGVAFAYDNDGYVILRGQRFAVPADIPTIAYMRCKAAVEGRLAFAAGEQPQDWTDEMVFGAVAEALSVGIDAVRPAGREACYDCATFLSARSFGMVWLWQRLNALSPSPTGSGAS